MEPRPLVKDWICEKCDKTFFHRDECEEHENKCDGKLK